MKKMNCLSIFIAATLLTGALALISILGTQSAMADDNNSHNKLKIDQGANQENDCKLNNELDKKGASANTFACANLAFNIVCLPESVCILPNEKTPMDTIYPLLAFDLFYFIHIVNSSWRLQQLKIYLY